MAKDKILQKYQRKLNRIIKNSNKMIEKDEMFLGRFYLRQIHRQWYKFEDHSGGELTSFIRVVDKKTNYYKDYRLEYAPWMSTFYWHFNMDMLNDFIVKACSFWEEEPKHTLENVENFCGIKPNKDIFDIKKYDWNFYENKEV